MHHETITYQQHQLTQLSTFQPISAKGPPQGKLHQISLAHPNTTAKTLASLRPVYFLTSNFVGGFFFSLFLLSILSGFGDFVPAQGVKNDSEISIALCSLYLLFGIALLAMSFNLVQEEVISNVKSVARRLGILKEEEMDD